jgi:hypothetical protein
MKGKCLPAGMAIHDWVVRDEPSVRLRTNGLRRDSLRFSVRIVLARLRLAKPKLTERRLVGAKGFEPSTPSSRTRCATRLRYAPIPLDERRYSDAAPRSQDQFWSL